MKTPLFVFLIFMLTACRSGTDKKSILQSRSKSNQAFKERNIDHIVKYLADDIAITTGNGTVIHGKDSLKNYVKAIFEQNKDLYFIRETAAVNINETTDRAWETGEWKGLRPETPDWEAVGGKYSAMWIKKDGEWKIRSQLFVRLY